MRTDRITPEHLQRTAIVYVRQSSPEQVRSHAESTRIQIGLRDKAVAFGSPSSKRGSRRRLGSRRYRCGSIEPPSSPWPPISAQCGRRPVARCASSNASRAC
jgi:hypothetical protein